MPRYRIEPGDIHIDVEAVTVQAALDQVCKRLTDAGFVIALNGGAILCDERAIDGTDSGSPVYVRYIRQD